MKTAGLGKNVKELTKFCCKHLVLTQNFLPVSITRKLAVKLDSSPET